MHRAHPDPGDTAPSTRPPTIPVSARVSPSAWWPAVLPAVPQGGFQPGDTMLVSLLGMNEPKLELREIKVSVRCDPDGPEPEAARPSLPVSSFARPLTSPVSHLPPLRSR